MSTNRFALIFFLFLSGSNLFAQTKVITSKYQLTKEGDVIRTLDYKIWGTGQIFRPWGTLVDTLQMNIKDFKVEDLSPYVDERFFDSVIAYYNSSDFEAMLFTNIDSVNPQVRKTKEDFYKLFRKVYGSVQNQSAIRREMVTASDTLYRYATLIYQGAFKAMAGEFSIRLNVTQKEKPHFVEMFFTPYDYSEIPFFSNISGLPLEYIKAKNITSLKKEASGDLWQRILNKKKLAKSLEVVNCDSLKQFTSNLILQGNSTYARVVYDMLNEDKYLALIFVIEDKKFKLYDLGFINKRKE